MSMEWRGHGPPRGRAKAGTRLWPNAFPLLPLEDEGRLNDMPLRENFIELVLGLRRKARLSAWQFAYGKLHDRMDGDAEEGALVARTPQLPIY